MRDKTKGGVSPFDTIVNFVVYVAQQVEYL